MLSLGHNSYLDHNLEVLDQQLESLLDDLLTLCHEDNLNSNKQADERSFRPNGAIIQDDSDDSDSGFDLSLPGL